MLLMVKRWAPLISQFLGSQALIQIVNLGTALLLLRFLPVDEYALFIISSFYLSIGSVGSDLNLSTALSTFGARIADNRSALSGLFVMVTGLRRNLFVVMMLIILAITPYIIKSHKWRFDSVVAVLLPVLLTVWWQQKLTLRTVILNIQHDSMGLFQIGITNAIARMLLTGVFCWKWPFAMVAVLCNLLALSLAGWIAKKRCLTYIDEKSSADVMYRKNVKKFIYPLLPAAVYFTVQGQISIVLISFFGSSNAIAEVGALGRFGQIFTFLGVLNGFFFLPKFSRIQNKEDFIKKAASVTVILSIGFSLMMCSAWMFPDEWLLLLGKNYTSLQGEVPLAFAGPIISYFYGFFFTLLAARAYTQGQYWYVVATMIVQILFIALVGIDTTHKALQLNLANATATMLVEIILLCVLIRKWQ